MQYFIVIDHYVSSILPALKKFQQSVPDQTFGLLIVTRNPEEYTRLSDPNVPIVVTGVDFDNADSLKQAVQPYYNDIAGVICRGDKQVQFLRKLIPCLPANVLVSSPDALQAATNKRVMRQLFQEHAPEITPSYIKVSDASEETIARVAQTVPYPVIIKPAGLVSSLLISMCRTEDELRSNLENTFAAIDALYMREERADSAEVIVEQFLEGDFYSIDAYALTSNKTYFCPPVAYVPAQKLGIDDFFLYKRFVPTLLSEDQIEAANVASAKAMQALGLQYTTAHIELILTADGWKIIEVGPRVGRFRNAMYRLGYGIDHTFNDLAVHCGHEPIIPKDLVAYCTAYSIYPPTEGILQEIHGIEALKGNGSVSSLKIFAEPGYDAKYAKNGGKALAEFIITCDDKAEYELLTKYIEEEVYAVIA